MAIAIALPSLMYVVIENQRAVFKEWGDKPSFTIFLKQSLDEAAATSLLSRLATNPNIATIRFIHRDDAYAAFSQSSGLNLYAEDDPNPLPHVLILTPKAEIFTQDRGAGLKKLIKTEKSVDLVLADLMWVDRLNAISLLVERSAALLAVVLVCGGVLTVGNTTRVLVDEHHKEIRVLKLVGATDSFVRRPFLYCGVAQGILAGVIALALVQLIFVVLDTPIRKVADAYLSNFEISTFTVTEAAVLVALSAVVGGCGARIGTSLNLRDPIN